MTTTGEIREHMEVVGSDGGHVGTVDRLERGTIRLTRQDDPDGTGQHHHHVPLKVVERVEAGQVRLTVTAREARTMAVGGLGLADVREGVPNDEEAGENAAGAEASPMGDQAGTGTGNIHGGGTMAPNGGGAGGTAAYSQGSGGGIAHDPNMDPSGRGDPDL